MMSSPGIGFVLRFGVSMMMVACSSVILIDSARTGEIGKDFVVGTKLKNTVQLKMLQLDEISDMKTTTTTTRPLLNPALAAPISNRPAAAAAAVYTPQSHSTAAGTADMKQIKTELGRRRRRRSLGSQTWSEIYLESDLLRVTKSEDKEEKAEEEEEVILGVTVDVDDESGNARESSNWHENNQNEEEEEEDNYNDKKKTKTRLERFLRFSDYIDPRDHPPQEPPSLINP